ncbi:MAG: hypothetical protein WCJ56_02030, partial [bacterium]
MNDDNKKKIMLMAGILVFLIGGFLVFYMLMGKKPTPDVANVVNTQPPLPSGKPFGQQNTNGIPAVVDPNKNAAGRDLLTPPSAPPMISSNASAINIADPFAGGPTPAPPPPPPPPPNNTV